MKTKTTDWDMLAASSPLNADAARAWVYGYDDDKPLLLEQAVAEIPAEKQKDPCFRNLIGMRKGRLVVIAYARSRRGRARWIVRCLCGRYELRTTKALRPDGTGDRCGPCDRVQHLRGMGT